MPFDLVAASRPSRAGALGTSREPQALLRGVCRQGPKEVTGSLNPDILTCHVALGPLVSCQIALLVTGTCFVGLSPSGLANEPSQRFECPFLNVRRHRSCKVHLLERLVHLGKT